MTGNNRGAMLFRIIVGVYLAYQGINLLRKLMTDKPDNLIFYAIFAVLFIVAGVVFAVWSVKNFVKSEKEDIEIKSYQAAEEKEAVGEEENKKIEVKEEENQSCE